jgi:dolichol-phosphate mannosyltransferase
MFVNTILFNLIPLKLMDCFKNCIRFLNFVDEQKLMSNSIVIIPTYNERENVQLMTDAVLALEEPFDILFVDDNSPDGTAGIIASIISTHPGRVHVINRPGKLGLGTAYITGFKWAISKDYAYIFEMDCDFSHDPADLIRLKKACINGAELAIGSRYCKGGKIENWPFSRWLLSYFANLYVRLVLWIGVHDSTAGFKCYTNKALRSINLDIIHFKGYAFQICMKYAVRKHRLKITEVPITFKDRIYGESKMSTGIFKEALIGVWKMRTMKL